LLAAGRERGYSRQRFGSSTERGTTPLFVTYADAGWQPITLAEDFHRDLGGNPC
jgi:hypothetical protein